MYQELNQIYNQFRSILENSKNLTEKDLLEKFYSTANNFVDSFESLNFNSNSYIVEFRKYKKIFDESNDGIFLVELNKEFEPRKLLDANRCYCNMLGFAKEKLLKIPVSEIFGGQSNSSASELIERLKTNNYVIFETILKKVDGTEIVVEINSHIIENTEPLLVLGLVREISDRKHKEEAIRLREKTIREVTLNTRESGKKYLDSLVINLCKSLDADYTFVGEVIKGKEIKVRTIAYCNKGVLIDNFEYDFEGSPCKKAIELESLTVTDNILSQYPGYRLFEELGIVAYTGVCLNNSDNKPNGILAALYKKPIQQAEFIETIMKVFAGRTGIEIERQNTENALRESEKRYQHISETVTDYLVKSFINNGKVIQTIHGPTCISVTGYLPEEYMSDGFLWYKMIYEDDRKFVVEKISGILNGNDKKAFEHRIYHKNGNIRWIRNNPVLFYNENCELIEYDAIITDISDLKAIELKMIEHEKQYKLLFNHMNSGCALFEMKYSNGHPFDCRFVEVNTNFEKIIGIKKELLINNFASSYKIFWNEELIQKYSQVASTGNPDKFEFYFVETEKYYEIAAYSPKIGFCAVIFNDITSRKRIELELQESEERYRKLIELSPDAICVYSSGKLVYLNKQCVKLVGAETDEEIIGTDILSYVHPDYKEIVKERSLKTLINKEILPVIEEKLIRLDGEIIDAEVTASPIIYNNKSSIQVIIRDITNRKKAELALRKSEERFSIAMGAVNDGIFEWDIETNEIFFSPKNYTMLGYEPYEFKANHFFWNNMVHPDDRELNYAKFEEHLQGASETYEIEYRIKTKSGQYKWVLERGKILEKTSDNLAKRVIGIHTDIDIRKESEENLKKEKNFVSNLMKISPVGIITTNEQATITYANDQAEQILNIKKNENGVYGWPKCKIYNMNGIEISFKHFSFTHNNISNSPQFNLRYILQWNKNKRKVISINMNPVKDLNSNFNGGIFTITDITFQVEAEQQLRNAKEQAEESDRLKSAFLANMSHEIRTPMNGIIGFSGLLGRDDLTQDKKSKYVRIIQNSTNQLLTIITDILDISKIEAGQMTIVDNTFNINQLLDELVDQFEKEKKDKEKYAIQIKSHKGLDAEKAEIIADKGRLSQVLTNLLGNALKFTEEGSIEFGYKLINNDKLIFFVKDTGIGISYEKQSIIFERFRQADDSTTRKFGGTGLGLAISRGILELLGGKIWVESIPNEGSVFYFSLPYKVAFVQKMTEPETTDDVSKDYNWQGKKILIVEDVEDNFLLIQEILSSTNAELIYAPDGKSSISIYKNDPGIDLILMDIQLPDITGYEAIKQILTINPTAIIVAQTAYGLIGDKEKTLSAGCKDYISKPIIRSHFLNLLKNYLNKKENRKMATS